MVWTASRKTDGNISILTCQFSSSKYSLFVWLITFRMKTFSFSDHWWFKNFIKSVPEKTPNFFLLKLNKKGFGLFYPNLPLDKVPAWQSEHCCAVPWTFLDIMSSLANIWTCEDNFFSCCEFWRQDVVKCLMKYKLYIESLILSCEQFTKLSIFSFVYENLLYILLFCHYSYRVN